MPNKIEAPQYDARRRTMVVSAIQITAIDGEKSQNVEKLFR